MSRQILCANDPGLRCRYTEKIHELRRIRGPLLHHLPLVERNRIIRNMARMIFCCTSGKPHRIR